MSAANTSVFQDAQWLRDPIFKDTKIVNVFHRDKEKVDLPENPKNVHTLFRKEITLRERPVKAVLAITGDDYYVFHLNDRFVVQGPEMGYISDYPYYWLDVTDFLQPGANCLAAHAYYHGLISRSYHSGDNRSGFMLALDVTYADNSKERFVTDNTWKCLPLPDAFPTGDIIGYKTQFAENIDLRKMPVDWRKTGFADADWKAPLIGAQDHVFTRQITTPLQHEIAKPISVKKVGKGHYFYDFGHEIVGHTRIRIQGIEGEPITVRHGEELRASHEVRYQMRANCNYEEKPILSGGKDLIEFFDYRAFRYMEILDAVTPPEVWVDVRHHPFDPARTTLTSSDPGVEEIWTICRNGVKMGAQGGFLDCPSREKGQYLGDAVITARSHLWLTGDASLTKKALFDFQMSRNIHPGLMAVAPGSVMQEIAEYSLQYPLLLEQYYRHTGDSAFAQSMIDAVFPGLFAYFAKAENRDGLLENVQDKWVLVDWPEGLRDDYDYEYAKDKANTVLNAFYYGALRTAASLERAVGHDGKAYDAKAERVAKGFAARLADPATGLYVDAPGSKHSSLHANAIPLAFGLTTGADKAKMLDLIRQKRLSCGVYIGSYVIEACFKNGAGDLGYDLLTSHDDHSWQEMLRNGATTCMETWGPEQKKNTSWCHPWSSSPIYLLTEYALGLSPGEPGWKKIRIAPAKIANLPDLTLTVPHPAGRITVQYHPDRGYTLTAPLNVPVDKVEPEGTPIMVRNEPSHTTPALSPQDLQTLAGQGWTERVGEKRAVWVSVGRQMLYILDGNRPVWQARCATAAAGIGAVANSMQTPLGWHKVVQKAGAGAPWGQIFRSLKGDHLWKPGDTVTEDLVLTRVFVLDGEEPGKNKGRDAQGQVVDSKQRAIYVHGTNAEERIGTPSSHGCIRLLNDDVITAFDLIPEGTQLLITEK
jgi:hypothetical protein